MTRRRDRSSANGLLPRMEARPHKDGKTVTYRYHPVGEKPLSLGTDRQAAIQQVLDLTGRAPDDHTFRQMWRFYQESPRWNRLSDRTKDDYRECWGREPGAKDKDDPGAGLAKVWAGGIVMLARPADVNRYLEVERAGAPIRANREVSLLSNLFKTAIKRGIIDLNPCKQVSRNPEVSRTRLVEKQELQPFVDWALLQGTSAQVIVSMAQFAALGGSRRIEFLTLHWPQVDEELVRLNRAKQRGGREKRELLARSEALNAVLDRMKARDGYSPMGAVFAAPSTGRPYSEDGFRTMWHRLLGKALKNGIIKQRFTFHDLRAHYATYYKLKFGVLPDMHEDPSTTARIYDRATEVRRQAL